MLSRAFANSVPAGIAKARAASTSIIERRARWGRDVRLKVAEPSTTTATTAKAPTPTASVALVGLHAHVSMRMFTDLHGQIRRKVAILLDEQSPRIMLPAGSTRSNDPLLKQAPP